jgi:predicted RNA-binding Zn ribbon-like protein
MSSHLVDGIALPDAVAGHPALDFCNTRAGWGSVAPKEYLVSWRALVLWVLDHDLIPADDAGRLLDVRANSTNSTGSTGSAGSAGPASSAGSASSTGSAASTGSTGEVAAELARAIRLRDAAYRAALAVGTSDDWTLVGREALAARSRSVLQPSPDGPAVWTPSGAAVTTPVDAVARRVEDLLTSPICTVVSACPGQGCGWLFADPRRRRRWCSMAVCGNRAKARRHAAGMRAGAPGPGPATPTAGSARTDQPSVNARDPATPRG